MDDAAEALRAALQFLDGGTRGFYACVAGTDTEVEVRVGDLVFAAG